MEFACGYTDLARPSELSFLFIRILAIFIFYESGSLCKCAKMAQQA